MNPNRRRERGAVLIVTIGILAVLLLMAISFARLMVLERDVSKNHREYVQAVMNAESGIERFVGWIREDGNFRPADNPSDPIASVWMFKNDLGSDVGAGRVELLDAQNPSFYYSTIGGRAYSGFVEDPTKNFYKLKVIDCASQINLNNESTNLLRAHLEKLGANIQTLAGAPYNEPPDWWRTATMGAVPNPFPAGVVTKILAKRQLLNDEFTSKDQIRTDVNGTTILNDNEFRLVKDLISVRGWKNERAIARKDAPLTLGGWSTGASLGWYYPTNTLPPTFQRKTLGLNNLLPSIEERYPININTAPKAVLISNFMVSTSYRRVIRNGTAALSTNGTSGTTPSGTTPAVIEVTLGGIVGPLSFAQAKQLAEAIITYRNDPGKGPFKEWQQFFLFMRRQNWLDQDLRDLVCAVACPNLMNNQFIPEKQRYFSVAKDMIQNPASEFCFNSMGYFDVTSLGWVRHPTQDVVAEAELHAEVKVWHVMYRNTQRDFLSGLRSSQNTITGPEPLNNVRTSNIDNASDATRLTNLYGNSKAARNGSPYEGWIQIHSERITMSPGNPVNFATGRSPLASQSLDVPFWDKFDGLPTAQGSSVTSFGQGATTGGPHCKKTGECIFRGESLAPDGAVFYSYNDEELAFDSTFSAASPTNNFRPDRGTVECWIKFPVGWASSRPGLSAPPPALGAHEPIFYMTQAIGTIIMLNQGGQPLTTTMGVTWKLERYGYELRSTRFIWLNPVPNIAQPINALPGGTFLWTESVVRIDGVGANGVKCEDNEWHRLVASWGGAGGNPDYTTQQLFLDDKQGQNFQAFQNSGGQPSNNTFFQLTSVDSPSEPGFPGYRCSIGGFIYSKTSNQNQNMHRGFRDNVGTVSRVSNCKIDEIRSYPGLWIGSPGQLNDPNLTPGKYRFDTRGAANASFFEGAFEVEETGRVAHVQFTTLHPTGYADQSFVPVNTDKATRKYSMRYAMSSNGNSWDGSDEGIISQAQAYGVDQGDDLVYRIEFQPLTADPVNVTPIVDDVTIYILVSPVFYRYERVFVR